MSRSASSLLLAVAASVLAAAATATATAFDAESLPPLLSSRVSAGANTAAEPNCPILPVPVAFPGNQLPQGVLDAIQAFNNTINNDFLTAAKIPGVSATITYMGSPVWSSGFGVADLATGRPFTPDTPSRIASISKVFVVMLAAVYQDVKGLLSLDDPVSKLVPQFSVMNPFYSGADAKAGASQVTLRHLLSQMSGLQREAPVFNNTNNFSVATVLQWLPNNMLILPPGTTPSYSNFAFALAGRLMSDIIAAADGLSYEAAVTRYILQPLGMNNTGFTFTPAVVQNVAVGYTPTLQPVPLINLGFSAPAGQMYASTNDLALLAADLMAATVPNGPGSKLGISAATAREILTSKEFLEPDGLHFFGLPWEGCFAGNHSMPTKGGNLPGYAALLALVPDLQLSLSLVVNGGMDDLGAAAVLMPPLVQAFSDALLPLQPTANPGPTPNDYVGNYFCFNLFPNQTVLNVNGKLVLLSNGLSAYLSLPSSPLVTRPDTFQFFVPQGATSCMMDQLLALDHQYVFFTRGSSASAAAALRKKVKAGSIASPQELEEEMRRQQQEGQEQGGGGGPVLTISYPGFLPGVTCTKTS